MNDSFRFYVFVRHQLGISPQAIYDELFAVHGAASPSSRAVKPTKVKPKLTIRKTMGLVAFTCKPKRFSVSILPRGKTIDSEYMIQYLKNTGKRFLSLKHNKVSLQNLHWQMDNARPHSAAATRDFLTRRGVPVVHQSPYSPDLNLCDRFHQGGPKDGDSR